MKYPVIDEKLESETLYLVATPIGNLGDISLRALYILENVDLILCEDTRRTGALLNHYDISCPLLSFHSHSTEARFLEIKRRLATEKMALVSDAGTPCISDPGAELVAFLLDVGFKTRPIPGPSAATAALSVSGFNTREFTFRGFLGKKGLRSKVRSIMNQSEVQVVYESPHRLAAFLKIIQKEDPGRSLVILRELTKLHEEIFRGSAAACSDYFKDKQVKGEITVLISGKKEGPDYSREEIVKLIQEGIEGGESLSEISKRLAKDLDIARNKVYDIGLELLK